jgi:ribonuclease VapC
LAFLYAEPGHDVVAGHIKSACISTVNLAEVWQCFIRDGLDYLRVQSGLEATPLEVVPFSAAQAAISAELSPLTKSAGLSLGDRACLALAKDRDATALTADRVWKHLLVGISIELIR